jgi:hypothetical protein
LIGARCEAVIGPHGPHFRTTRVINIGTINI